MPRGSNRYMQLKRRLHELRNHLLPFLPEPPVSKVLYNVQEIDSTRAYIVLAHAEIEAFCEDIVREKARTAKGSFDVAGRVTPVLRRIVSYYVGKNRRSWSDVRTPSADVVEKASQSYFSAINENNGIKRTNLEKLLYPVGVLERHMDTTWVAQMDSFGGKRGRLAHSSVRAGVAPDPLTELTTVNQLLDGLLALDRALAGLR
jgi:hypothetical protein